VGGASPGGGGGRVDVVVVDAEEEVEPPGWLLGAALGPWLQATRLTAETAKMTPSVRRGWVNRFRSRR
jgi:hypothetical protein